MAKTIEEEILELSPEDTVRLSLATTDNYNSDSWKAQRRLQETSEGMVLRVTYLEMFKKDFSYLHRD